MGLAGGVLAVLGQAGFDRLLDGVRAADYVVPDAEDAGDEHRGIYHKIYGRLLVSAIQHVHKITHTKAVRVEVHRQK